jgi:PAS domain S-box-containing protein
MASITYPFIDLAVLDGVREHLARGDALLLLSENLDDVLLANFAGALMIGFEGPFDVVGENPELGISAVRQIHALDLAGNRGHVFTIGLRLAGGVESRMIMVSVGSARLPGGEMAVVLSWPQAEQSNRAIIHGMDDDSTHFALLDKTGAVLSASSGFAALHLSDFDLAQLTVQTYSEADRMVKRRLKSGPNFIPVGMGRLRDDPALFILLAIADSVRIEEHVKGKSGKEVPPLPAGAVETIVAPVASQIQHSAPLSDVAAPSASVSAPAVELQTPTLAPNYASVNELTKAAADLHPDFASQPVRFTWKIDAEGKFSSVSPELGAAIGKNAADVVGRSFKDVATVFAFDHGGEIADLLARRDTWSGRCVLWPIEGTDMRVPVDLAALPAYDRDRNFEGFRGFGIVRLADAVVDPEALGLALVSAPETPIIEEEEDPWFGEVPAITISEPIKLVPQTDTKIVQLGEHRLNKEKLTETSDKNQLTPIERNAFREIADRLRRDGLTLSDPSPTGPGEAAPQFDAPASDAFAGPAAVSDFADLDSIDTDAHEIDDLLKLDQNPDAELTPVDMDPDYSLPFDPEQEISRQGLSRKEKSRLDHSQDAPILSKLPVPVLIHNGSSLLYGNPAFFELTLYSSLEDLEQEGGIEHLLHVTGPDNDSMPSSKIVLADNNEKPVRAHLHTVRWKGERALLLSLRPLDNENANIEDTQTIDRLTREVSELSSVLETATDGVVFVNNDGTIRSINQSAEALFGFDPASVSGKPFTHLLATESQKTANDYIANLAGTGVASLINDGREVIGREAHGRFIPLFMTIGKLDGDSGFCVVLRDITQWKRAEEDLSAAKRAAEHASTQKSEFLARVSHEIRTPLNAIIGFSDMMSEERFGPVGNPRYLDYLNDINRSGRHVLDLVNDLLDISKIEAGQQEMNFEAVGLNDALSEAVSIMQPQANRQRVIIRSSFATELPEVVADARSIKQIALNLLSNAVRYTGPGGQVIVSTSYELTGGVTIRVRDTGVGMSPQDIETALKPFKQINTLKRERGDGTGLGLPLTKAMVEANRANFAISSTPGQGTLIEITFPSTRVLAD